MNERRSTQQPTADTDFVLTRGVVLQRACACGNHSHGGGECAECKKQRVQRAATNAAPLTAIPPIVHGVLGSPGQPLDRATRQFMEPRFGHDFSNVRVHADTRASESAQAVNALAYTVGRDVVFGAGQYKPTTNAGRNLLAHELTHVVQQAAHAGALAKADLHIDPSNAAEREARVTADRILCGTWRRGVVAGATGLQRLGVALQRGADTCSGVNVRCAAEHACLTPDKPGDAASGESTNWALVVNIDIERADWESALRSQQVGHTHVRFMENSGREFTYGFYPAGETPNENKREVPGCVHHPDTTHDACIDSRVTYSLTKTQYEAGLAAAQKICKDRHVYGVNYTCTTFAADVVTAAGQSLPSSKSAKTTIYYQPVPEIDNPNTLYENVQKEKEKDPNKQKGFWNTTAPPTLRLKPVSAVGLRGDPNTPVFQLDWLPLGNATFRWRLYDVANQHYLMRGAEADHPILDWLSYTSSNSAIIGAKTRELLAQRKVTEGVVECAIRSADFSTQVVAVRITFVP